MRHRRKNHALFSPIPRLTCNATVISVATPMRRSFAVLSFLAFLVACAGAPVQEMSDARQAIQAARAAGAPTRAPDDFSAAQAAIQRAESQLQQHEYSSARQAAIEAKHDASVALAQAQSTGGTNPSP